MYCKLKSINQVLNHKSEHKIKQEGYKKRLKMWKLKSINQVLTIMPEHKLNRGR